MTNDLPASGGMYSRRRLLAVAGGLGAMSMTPLRPALAQGAELPPTPECTPAGSATPRQTEGPYFTPRSPLKRDFRADAPGGRRLLLAGFVLTTACRPVPRALVDLWHADAAGAYDNHGYRLRGHQFTDEQGRYWFDTIIPGAYPGRTRHLHVKVQAADGPVLTTQLYLPGEAGNRRDRQFDEALLMRVSDTGAGLAGRFDFVLGQP
ncbi:dioxygenase family protein [Arenibaculum pallidiluteum]|uniref:dioxygenase family protein n=1 Tax=Arenibaculum pallidiluteum TaxID=2812559 RepID=UPI001A975F08|nr:intradiol ring-cleavage dioxygenase [Arenibaculum pallidiluteum]